MTEQDRKVKNATIKEKEGVVAVINDDPLEPPQLENEEFTFIGRIGSQNWAGWTQLKPSMDAHYWGSETNDLLSFAFNLRERGEAIELTGTSPVSRIRTLLGRTLLRVAGGGESTLRSIPHILWNRNEPRQQIEEVYDALARRENYFRFIVPARSLEFSINQAVPSRGFIKGTINKGNGYKKIEWTTYAAGQRIRISSSASCTENTKIDSAYRHTYRPVTTTLDLAARLEGINLGQRWTVDTGETISPKATKPLFDMVDLVVETFPYHSLHRSLHASRSRRATLQGTRTRKPLQRATTRPPLCRSKST
jgi:hypothetical protein